MINNHNINVSSFHPQTPFHMVWIATNECNARCRHCSSDSGIIKPDELKTEEAFNLIDQLVAFGIVDLAISGGEPLLRPDIFKIIHHAKKYNLSVGVGSNGAFLTNLQAKRLENLGVNRFQVSLDGFNFAHNTLRNWVDLFDRALKTIRTARAAGLRTHICCTINHFNINQLEEFTKFVSELDVQRLNFSRYVPTGRGCGNLDLSDEDWKYAIHLCNALRNQYKGKLEIVAHLAQQILIDKEIANIPSFIGCQAGIGQGCVTENGTVLPCVLLPIPLGNVRITNFSEIWKNSPIIKALQNRDNLKGYCGVCSLKNRCGGCRAVAFAKTGDYLKADPRCWLRNI